MASVGIAAVVMAVTLAPSGATPPSGLTNTLLASGTNQSEGTIPLKLGTNVVFAQITVTPGGSSGWHSHPGGAIVTVQQGSLTVYEAVGDGCEIATYSAGQTFVERSGELDQVINTGAAPYTLYVLFPRVPVGALPRTDEPNPGTCPGII
jgi:quercetin dioxygenase-like cupin family protein